MLVPCPSAPANDEPRAAAAGYSSRPRSASASPWCRGPHARGGGRSRCDLLLAVGSTLGVFPAAGLVPVAVRHGAVVVIVNGGPTEMDDLADVVVQGSISELPAWRWWTGLPPAG